MKNETLTLTQRRIAIIQDAISQIKAQKYLTGNYGYVTLLGNLNEDERESAQQVLCETEQQCGVCAKGALLLSTIRKENEFDFYKVEALSHEELMDRLSQEELFEKSQLTLIEAFYEHVGGFGFCVSDFCSYRANGVVGFYFSESERREFYQITEKFVVKYPSNNGERDDRLLAILNNMLENEGIFEPHKMEL